MSGKSVVTVISFFLVTSVLFAGSVGGSIDFKEPNGSTHSLGFAKVEVLDGSSVIATTTTDGNGTFSATTTSDPSTVKIRVTTDTNYVKVVSSGSNTYSMTSGDVSYGTSIRVTFEYNGDTSAAFFIQKKLGEVIDYAETKLTEISSTESISKLTVYFPSQSSYYIANTINISDDDKWDASVIMHEGGHHIHGNISIIPMGGTHYTDGIYDPRLAWTEGFASYFASAVSGSQYSIFGIDIDNLSGAYPSSPGNELRVSAALWNLHNDSNGGPANILKALDAMEYPDYRNVWDFYKKWLELGLDKGTIEEAFDREGIKLAALTSHSTDFDSGSVNGTNTNYNWTAGWSRHQSDPKPWGVTWRGDNNPATTGGSSYSGSSSLNYNDDTNYDTGFNYGWAQTPIVDLSAIDKPVLTFKCNYETDTIGDSSDKRKVRVINADTGAVIFSATLSTTPGSQNLRECQVMGYWHSHALNMNPGWGRVHIQFYFTSVTSTDNDHNGWFIDDVSISGGGSGVLPFAPTNMGQYKADGSELSKAEVAEATKIIFKATLNSDDANAKCKFQVEVKPYNQPFDGTITGESNWIENGSEVSVEISGLSEGDKQWRGRVVDSNGNVSNWSDFGNDVDTTDFIFGSSSLDSGSGGGGKGCSKSINIPASGANSMISVLAALIIVSFLYNKVTGETYKRA